MFNPGRQEKGKILQLMSDLALKSGKLAMENWGKIKNQDIKYKNPGNSSPVTKIDLEINTIIIKGLNAHYPDFSVVSEESPNLITDFEKPFWIIDHIDGTGNFIKGGKDF